MTAVEAPIAQRRTRPRRQRRDAAKDDAPVRAGRARQSLRSVGRRGRAQPRLRLLDEGAWRADARLGRSLFLASRRGRRHPRRDEARRRVDHHRPAARHGRGHGRDARGYRAAVRRRHRAAGRRRHQAVAPRAAIRPDEPGGEFPQARARHVGGHPRPAGEARRPAAQHAHAALHQATRKSAAASRARRWRFMRRWPSASACTR